MAIQKVTWTESAIRDLRSICSHIAQDSPENARKVSRKIFESTRNLAEFPYIGHKIPETGFGPLRQLLVYKYRIIYRVNAETVSIVTVIHGARLLHKAILGRRKSR